MRLDGITPILSMPFDEDGSILFEGLARQIDFLEGAGVRALGFGFGSEIVRLTDDELVATLRAAVKHANGRFEVMATVGGGSVRALVANGEAATEAGASILMVRPPAGASAELVIECCTRLAAATGRPLVVQDAPTMTGVELVPSAIADLVAAVPAVIAVKIEAEQPARKIGALARAVGDSVSILGGAGGLDFVNELARGAHGTVPFVALAPMFVRVHRLFIDGQEAAARDLFARYLPLLVLALRSVDTAMFVFKELLRRKGVLSRAYLRAPFEPLDDGLLDDLERTLVDLDRWGVPW